MPDGTYLIQTDYGQVNRMGGDYIGSFYKQECKDLYMVFDDLVMNSFHDPNTCGDLIYKSHKDIKYEEFHRKINNFHIGDMKDNLNFIEAMKSMKPYNSI